MLYTNDLSSFSGLSMLMESCPYPLAVCDSDGRILLAGHALCSQLHNDHLIGMPVAEALPQNGAPQLLGQLDDAHWLYGWLCTSIADDEQAASENRILRLALEQIGLYVFEYRIDRDELHLLTPLGSDLTEEQVWHGGPELISEYIHASEEDALYLADTFASAAFGRSASLDVRSYATGAEHWLRLTLSPMLRDARMTGTVIGTILNVTSQKQTEQRVTRDSAFRNNVLAGISSGWELELEQNCWAHLWNGEPALTQLSQEQLSYNDYDMFFAGTFRLLVHPDDWAACTDTLERGALLARFRRGEHTCTGEYRIRSRTSEAAPYEWRSVTVRLSRDPATLQPKASCHVTDISPQKANELEAQRGRREMEQTARAERRANARKSQFLADTARTLHAPLRAMVGVSELALTEQMSDTARDYLQQIHDFGGDLLQALSDVLALAGTGSQPELSTEEEYSPLTLLDSVAEIARSSKSSELTLQLDGAVPARLYGDSMRLQQALINLTGSALRASPAVQLTLSCAMQDSEHAVLRAVIADRHNTLSESQLENLFVAFSDSYYGGGTGLALSQARQLARWMDGALTAYSSADRGICFELTVPQRVIDPRPVESL